MKEQKPRYILCAVRGGQESRNTVSRAIDLALAYDARLTFFHVLDAEFLGSASLNMAPMSSIYQQLREMGTFMMLILCDRASRRGVAKVDFKIDQGNISQVLRQTAIATHADILVMGRPVRSPGSNVFAKEAFEAFVRELEQETDPHIVVVSPEVPAAGRDQPFHGIIPPQEKPEK